VGAFCRDTFDFPAGAVVVDEKRKNRSLHGMYQAMLLSCEGA
jgi:hypothetical protein